MTLATDAKFMIENGPETAEAVLYVPHGGIPRTINVLVMRSPLQSSDKEPGNRGPKSTQSNPLVYVVNDLVLGVAIPQKGRDEIHLKEHICDTKPTRYVVSAVLHEDTGMFQLEVVK